MGYDFCGEYVAALIGVRLIGSTVLPVPSENKDVGVARVP